MDYKTDSTLSELLNDPLVLVLMQRDGVSREQVERLFERLRDGHRARKERIAA
ncbi:hypothetical protein [Azospirillum sp. SYSU D00513]|uniref:hypothetical protein n=1 Tax=Azospirillum sp. SYSU D00513 TaxID=2812561 RepID=UPI001A95FA64|nr:hypothetical protein [Azospirillum sp. SYSU D00513]